MNDQVRLKTAEELATEAAAREADAQLVLGQVNELLDLLNPVTGEYATELTLMTPSGPKAFNVSPLFTALTAQFQHFLGHCHDQHDLRWSPQEKFFPEAITEKEGEKLVKRQYFFDWEKRHVRMILTFATVFMAKDGPTTIGQPRYDTEYVFLGNIDNYTWRATVNWVCGQFDRRKYIHLYSHDFQYIWNGETNTVDLIPAGAEVPKPVEGELIDKPLSEV